MVASQVDLSGFAVELQVAQLVTITVALADSTMMNQLGR
jgi:hypothetical protein